MAGKQRRIPSLVHHKPTGQARVRIGGVDIYCGKWGSPQAEEKYRRTIAEWLTSGKVTPPPDSSRGQITISELILAFWRHAEKHYVKNGQPTGEQACLRSALRPLRELYGGEVADEFGPLALKAVRQKYVDNGWCRAYVNKSVSRIRLVFRWGVENELVSPITLQALEAIQGLKVGRSNAPDRPRRRPVPIEHVEAVRQVVRQRTRDMIDLQLLTSARPGELVNLTTAMIDRSEDVWIANLTDHKTAHLGMDRILLFGPRCQLILRRYLNDNAPTEKLFKLRRVSYGNTVRKACIRAGIDPPFTPHWLRHTAATDLREKHGIEVAQVMLGHSKIDMTQWYAQANVKAAVEVARKVG